MNDNKPHLSPVALHIYILPILIEFHVFLAWDRAYVSIACLSSESNLRILLNSFLILVGQRKVLPIWINFNVPEPPSLQISQIPFWNSLFVPLLLNMVDNILVLCRPLILGLPKRYSTYPKYHKNSFNNMLKG